MREIVLFVPVGGHRATVDIARGSAIVGEPRAGAEEVKIYFGGAIFGQENMRTLADRAKHAAGRMLERYATAAARVVPRDALVAVGTFDFRESRISLTGSDSERPTGPDVAHLAPDVTVTVNQSLGEALIERAGISRDGEDRWVDGEGRRTSTISEALIWALVLIAEGD